MGTKRWKRFLLPSNLLLFPYQADTSKAGTRSEVQALHSRLGAKRQVLTDGTLSSGDQCCNKPHASQDLVQGVLWGQPNLI